METYRIEVGRNHKVMPGHIVGAIANEAEMDSKYIGRIDIHDDYSLVDLPEGMPKEIFNLLKHVWVAGRQLAISRVSGNSPRHGAAKPAATRKGVKKKSTGKKKSAVKPRKKRTR